MTYSKVVEVDEIGVGQGTLIERGGTTIAVFNAGGGRFYATSPTCPHEDRPRRQTRQEISRSASARPAQTARAQPRTSRQGVRAQREIHRRGRARREVDFHR